MTLNISKVEKLIRKDLNKHWSSLNFEIECNPQKIKVTNNLSIAKLSNDVRVEFGAYSNGVALFLAIFSHIEKTPKTLDLLNEFNKKSLFFKAIINDKGFLEVLHICAFVKEEMFENYCSEFLIKLSNLNENEVFCKLVSYTY